MELKEVASGKSASEPRKTEIRFTWDIHFRCNYRCPYCWFYHKGYDYARDERHFSTEEWVIMWKNIFEKYGPCYIEIASGEPFIYPNFVSLVREISKIHLLTITTNLSVDIDDFVKQIDSSMVKIGVTFHPSFADFDKFIKKAQILKEHGFIDTVNYLAYPPQIKQLDYFKKKFKQNGLAIMVTTFWGEHNGIKYPEGYTQQEIRIIDNDIGKRNKEEYQLKPKEVKGRLCHAGYKYALIKPCGSVVRCSQLSDRIIGNFFQEDFRLLDKPEPCEADSCPCNEYA